MTYYLESKTIWLDVDKEIEVDDDFFVDVLVAEDAMIYPILELSKQAQWISITLVWIVVLIYSYFRSILYTHFFQKYKKKEFIAINVLTLVRSVLEHSTLISLPFAYTMMVVADAPLDEITGPWFCYPITLLYRFVIFYSALGSLGISIYRILLLRHEVLVRYTIGLDNTMYIILASGLILAAVFTFLISITDYEVLFTKTCTIMQPERRRVLNMLDTYDLSRGNPSIYAYWRDVRIGLALCMLLTTFSQISIYTLFFCHLYQHDNTETLRRLLDEKVIKLRNRRNSITFLGQFCSFVFDLTFTVLLHLTVWMGNKENKLVGITTFMGGISSTGGAIIEVLTSPSLREKLFQ